MEEWASCETCIRAMTCRVLHGIRLVVEDAAKAAQLKPDMLMDVNALGVICKAYHPKVVNLNIADATTEAADPTKEVMS